MNRLEVRNLSVSVDGTHLLDNLSFELGVGERLVIIGPNGAGKTVLLESLLGLMQHNGEVEWAKDVRIGYVPQKIDADRHLPITYRDLFVSKCRIVGESVEKIAGITESVGLAKRMLERP